MITSSFVLCVLMVVSGRALSYEILSSADYIEENNETQNRERERGREKIMQKEKKQQPYNINVCLVDMIVIQFFLMGQGNAHTAKWNW